MNHEGERYYVTRRARFSAAHRLNNPALSDDRNREIYGKCNNPAGHGHNYTLEVTVEGTPDPETGMVVNFNVLDGIIEERIIRRLDHLNLNEDVDFLRGKITTVENLAAGIWRELEPHIPRGRLFQVKVFEAEESYVVYRGPGSRTSEDKE